MKYIYPTDDSFKVAILGPEAFSTLTSDPDLEDSFKYVGLYDEFIAKLFLQGTYRDSQGRSYSFAPGGQCDFRGQSLRYSFDSGELGEDLNLIKIGDVGYRFNRHGSRLQLTRQSPSDATVVEVIDLKRTRGSDP